MYFPKHMAHQSYKWAFTVLFLTTSQLRWQHLVAGIRLCPVQQRRTPAVSGFGDRWLILKNAEEHSFTKDVHYHTSGCLILNTAWQCILTIHMFLLTSSFGKNCKCLNVVQKTNLLYLLIILNSVWQRTYVKYDMFGYLGLSMEINAAKPSENVFT